MRLADATAPRAATFLERTSAYLVDAVVTFVVFVLVALLAAQGDLDALLEDPAMGQVVAMLFLVVPFGYFVAAEGLTGTTVGKRLLSLRVVGPGGAPAGLFAAAVRNVLRLAWALALVGPFFLLLDVVLLQLGEDDQRLGDAAAGTRVLRVARGHA